MNDKEGFYNLVQWKTINEGLKNLSSDIDSMTDAAFDNGDAEQASQLKTLGLQAAGLAGYVSAMTERENEKGRRAAI